jgi:multidrug resistance efflux pump
MQYEAMQSEKALGAAKDQTAMQARVRELTAQAFTYEQQLAALNGEVARLKAVSEGTDFVPPEEAVKESPEIVAQEQQLYLATRNELAAALSIAQQQLAQRRQELNEASARREQAAHSYNLTAQELAGKTDGGADFR